MEKLEIIALNLAREFSNTEVLYFIDNFKNIEEIEQSKLGTKFKERFEKSSLFDNQNEYIDKAHNQLRLAEENNSEIISINENKYPELLKNIADPPPILFIKGKLQNSDDVSISVVGTRRATSYGKLVVERFVSQLVENKVIITSGMAYGIDSYAHDHALRNKGITYAVIASGLDKINTERSEKLSKKIIENGGCIISSYPFGVNALNPFFIRRNRIISGISKATIVVESAIKGGSLWTAKFAVEQNRDLFAVPGSIFEPKSQGTNNLIDKEMARPAISVDQILRQIGFAEINNNNNNRIIEFSNAEEEKIFNLISFNPTHIDDIANKAEIPIANVAVNLLSLEFNSLVRQLPGKLYIRNTN